MHKHKCTHTYTHMHQHTHTHIHTNIIDHITRYYTQIRDGVIDNASITTFSYKAHT